MNAQQITRVVRLQTYDGQIFDTPCPENFNMANFTATVRLLGSVTTPEWWVPIADIRRIYVVSFVNDVPTLSRPTVQ